MTGGFRKNAVLGFWIFVAAFGVLTAYTQRIPAPEMPAAVPLWHEAMIALCRRLFGDAMLIGRALPTALAGAATVLFTFGVAARGNLYRGLAAAAMLLGCMEFLLGARYCATGMFYLAALSGAVFAGSFLPKKAHSLILFVWMGVWAIFGWDGFKAADYFIPRNFYDYALLSVLLIPAALTGLWDIVRTKHPDLRLLLGGALILLVVAPAEVWFYSTPLAAWRVADFLTAGARRHVRLRNAFLWLLRGTVWGLTAAFVLLAVKWRSNGYDMPLMIPGGTLAVLSVGVFAAGKLKMTLRVAVLAALAGFAGAAFVIMVLEPYWTLGK
ncbi:MAG: hypothetical protein PHI85_07510 [Victivallaceae bacterium]|nr:hypothetical protein [Victivallaceae bacterium]